METQLMAQKYTIPDQKLSKNFALREFLKSGKANTLGISNDPAAAEKGLIVANLMSLAGNVLQKARDHFGKPVRINSGFRNSVVNKEVGSSETSQHRKGEAADVEIEGIDNLDLARWLVANTDFDQLILENYSGGNSGWVHVSHKRRGKNRKQVLTFPDPSDKSTWYNGLPTSSLDAKVDQAKANSSKIVLLGGFGAFLWYMFQKR